ncbi:MAG: type II secretion system protein [Sedimentisphaerales bacterium]|nr:type II secretion system protein [Sedimentisphaerales bacterium]
MSRVAVTLVELLMVLAILVILAAVAGIGFSRLDTYLKCQATRGLMVILDGALAEYAQEEGGLPDTTHVQGGTTARSQFLIRSLEAVPASREVLDRADKRLFKDLWPKDSPDGQVELYDPWQMPVDYNYVPPASLAVLRSAGPDRLYMTSDDITNR